MSLPHWTLNSLNFLWFLKPLLSISCHLPFCVLQCPGDTDYVQQFLVYHSFEVLIHSLFIWYLSTNVIALQWSILSCYYHSRASDQDEIWKLVPLNINEITGIVWYFQLCPLNLGLHLLKFSSIPSFFLHTLAKNLKLHYLVHQLPNQVGQFELVNVQCQWYNFLKVFCFVSEDLSLWYAQTKALTLGLLELLIKPNSWHAFHWDYFKVKSFPNVSNLLRISIYFTFSKPNPGTEHNSQLTINYVFYSSSFIFRLQAKTIKLKWQLIFQITLWLLVVRNKCSVLN